MHPEQCCGELQRGTGPLLSPGTAWGWKCCCQRGCGTVCASCASLPGWQPRGSGLQPLCMLTCFSAACCLCGAGCAFPGLGWAGRPVLPTQGRRGAVSAAQQGAVAGFACRSWSCWVQWPGSIAGRAARVEPRCSWGLAAAAAGEEAGRSSHSERGHAGSPAPGLQAPRLPPEQHHGARGGSACAHSRSSI